VTIAFSLFYIYITLVFLNLYSFDKKLEGGQPINGKSVTY